MQQLLMWLLLGWTLATSSVWAGEVGEWRLDAHDEQLDVKVYTREIPGSVLREFKGVTHTQASLSSLVAILLDAEFATQWMDKIITFDVIDVYSPQQHLLYIVNQTPWPVKNRDIYLQTEISQDESGTVTVSLIGQPEYGPERAKRVRMASMRGAWTFTPTKEQGVQVSYQAHADPSGQLPAWLVNSIVIDMPLNSLRNLHQVIDNYAGASLDFIQDLD